MKIIFLLCAFLFIPLTTNQQWINGQDADLVVGQDNFTSRRAGKGPSSFRSCTGMAIDFRNNKIYVADRRNNRVLRYSYPFTSNRPVAEMVFGQPDFETSDAETRAARKRNTFLYPTGVAVDHTGRLFVSDENNHRVVWFNDAHTINTNQPNADGVLGQPDFVTDKIKITQDGMANPRAITIDQNGTLWVADWANSRVLRFDNAASKSNGANADGVLGQSSFITRYSGRARQNEMYHPAGVCVDQNGTLWVADSYNNRVLRFDNATNKPNGADADGVLGQVDFNSRISRATRSNLSKPVDVAIDISGRLYIADSTNDRILIFDNAANKLNGANANRVLGQENYTDKRHTVGINRLNSGSRSSLAIDNNNGWLWHSDQGNSRILRFASSAPLATIIPDENEDAKRIFPSDKVDVLKNKLTNDSETDVILFPNPFSNVLNYKIPNGETIQQIRVFNNLGQEIKHNFSTQQNGQIEFSSLPAGKYLIIIETPSKVFKKSVIKI